MIESDTMQFWRNRGYSPHRCECGVVEPHRDNPWHWLRHHANLPADSITVTAPHYAGLLAA